jgi:hypothetical protein
MQRLRRPILGILTLWFALYASVPQLLHFCPDHSPFMPASVASATVSHDHHAAPGTSRTGESDDRQGSDECCCPGPSCGTSAVLFGELRAPAIATLLTDVVRVGDAGDIFALAPVPHLLPFATAPPAV